MCIVLACQLKQSTQTFHQSAFWHYVTPLARVSIFVIKPMNKILLAEREFTSSYQIWHCAILEAKQLLV